jgi:hypothetical protein
MLVFVHLSKLKFSGKVEDPFLLISTQSYFLFCSRGTVFTLLACIHQYLRPPHSITPHHTSPPMPMLLKKRGLIWYFLGAHGLPSLSTSWRPLTTKGWGMGVWRDSRIPILNVHGYLPSLFKGESFACTSQGDTLILLRTK